MPHRDEPCTSGILTLIGFGANVGNPTQDAEGNCREAVGILRQLKGFRLLATSALYRTEPIGYTNQPWFINGVVLGETVLSPRDLLRALLDVEKTFGRVRTTRWGPRPLDLDIIFYGNLVMDSKDLVIPHPRAHERRFVLEPAYEVCPDYVHPVLGVSVRELLHRPEVQAQDVQRWKSL
ncbi:MAG: 2-amino-4-hydroxy-6-hydroxymethyldihydropteridine diphosphokinase [Desulfosoma sp.]